MLKVDGIRKSFSGNDVLRGVSFSIKQGEIYGLIGKNGAGKTTLLNIMAGLMDKDAGTLKKDGVIGYLPDLPNFFEYLKTDEYLDFLLMDKDKKRRDELLDMVGLKSGLKVKTMSRGMRQRLGIAAALVNNPDIILFDEPTSALDPLGRKDVKDILLNLKDKGKTIVLSTHILADMDKICDRAGFLHNGIIAKEVDVRESADDKSYIIVGFKEKIADDFLRIFETYEKINENMVKIFIDGMSKDRSQKKIFKILSETEYEVSSISTKEHTLDDIFEEVCVK
ncbi:ABC-2 type transport system ATP-binding protein [Lachnospiraceae bacterium RM5]|nr:ABC-2 type transport system ATP-binding protein [Lachnospiraceae bacterium RM5]